LNTLDIHKILEMLPHRYPFLMVDRIVDFEPEKSLTAIKNVTVNEPFFPGHFPYRPVMPGVMILESMVQAAAILAALGEGKQASEKEVYYFVGVDNARFKRPVEPGDQLRSDIKLDRKLRGIWKCSGVASVDGQTVCTAEMMFTFKATE